MLAGHIQYWLHRFLGRPFPPSSGSRVVDRSGRRYELIEDLYEGGATYTLRSDPPHKHERGRAGYMHLHLKEAGVLKIADLHLAAFARRRGLGTQMLGIARQYAEAHDATRIVGSVARKDVEETPYLLDWYARQVFDAVRRGRADAHWVANIVCRIRSDTPGHDLLDPAGSSAEDGGV